ncbi:MAG: ribonuclease H-like domain-containing protein [Actinomycetota bacterium]
MNRALALDIETTGIDPHNHSVVAIGVADGHRTRAFLGNEDDILRDIQGFVADLVPGSLLITWNGEEFDLPFLRSRFEALDISTSLTLRSKGGVGKYGKPLYEAVWGHVRHVDIAPMLRSRAEQLGVRWGLKPVARALLGLEPVEVDNTGESIAMMEADTLTRYVLSDAAVTFALASHLNETHDLTLGGVPATRSIR